VLSSDSHTVKPWFAGKVPFSVDMPNLSGTDFELVGGRLTYVQQVPAAQLVFGIRKHRISVFMLRDGAAVATLGNDTAPVRRTGFNTQTWVEDGVRYFAISDVNPADIRKLCDLLKQAG
jgi:anti-sigma factor RsiW